MKDPPSPFPIRYRKALRSHLERGTRADLSPAMKLGAVALTAGMETLELAKLHEATLVQDLLPAHPSGQHPALIKQAAVFFATMASAVASGGKALESTHFMQVIETLSDRSIQLVAANQLLGIEIIHRKEVEASLKKNEGDYLRSLAKSNELKEQLRGLSRRILSAQEDERKKISRELHDVIAQELIGINLQLATLKKASGITAKGLSRNITITQHKVMKSATIIHQFARELRPTALDDLGLVPALLSFMTHFTERTGIRTRLTSFTGLDKLNTPRRTALYRVVQEALCNTARHAHADKVDVIIAKERHVVQMDVVDDGCSFDVDAALPARGNRNLGLLGMRERIEMISGVFSIESKPGMGTRITVHIPVPKALARQWALDDAAKPPNPS